MSNILQFIPKKECPTKDVIVVNPEPSIVHLSDYQDDGLHWVHLYAPGLEEDANNYAVHVFPLEFIQDFVSGALPLNDWEAIDFELLQAVALDWLRDYGCSDCDYDPTDPVA